MENALLEDNEFAGSDELDAETLAEIEALAAEVNADVEPAELNLDGEHATEIEAEEIAAAKKKIYEDADASELADAEKETKKGRRKTKTAKAAAPKLKATSLEDVIGTADTEIIEARRVGLAKKVAEKAGNVVDYVRGARSACSVYTKAAFLELRLKGSLTSSDLVQLFNGLGYKDGTCRAQGQQQMMLLPALMLAERVGNTLTYAADTKMSEALSARLDGKA